MGAGPPGPARPVAQRRYHHANAAPSHRRLFGFQAGEAPSGTDDGYGFGGYWPRSRANNPATKDR